MARASQRKTSRKDVPSSVKAVGSLTPLNFKVPEEFHRDFKTFAAQRSKKMVEVLQEAFALVKEKYGSQRERTK